MIGWLDCSSGISGDMLLGALVDSGVPLAFLQAAVDAISPEPVVLTSQRVTRAGVSAIKVDVQSDSTQQRSWRDLRELVAASPLPMAIFTRLAQAESRAHGLPVDDVRFHEVGGLDSLAEIVAASAGLAALDVTNLIATPIALGGGMVHAVNGRRLVPSPAVVEVLADLRLPSHGGPVDTELTTPRGAAILGSFVTGFGPMPPMRVSRQGVGAGSADIPGQPNVLRLVLGEPVAVVSQSWLPSGWETDASATLAEDCVVLETNVDDLDPRIWPDVMTQLLGAGATDTWLTPILQQGRPAHTLHVLCDVELADDLREIVFAHTSSTTMRTTSVGKLALDRRMVSVEVDGHPIRVREALASDGTVLNRQPEWEDVLAAARALDRPAKSLLHEAMGRVRS